MTIMNDFMPSPVEKKRNSPWSSDECILVIWVYHIIDIHPRIDRTSLYCEAAKIISRTSKAVEFKVQNVAACDPRDARQKPVYGLKHMQMMLRKLFEEHWKKRSNLDMIAKSIILKQHSLWNRFNEAENVIFNLISNAQEKEDEERNDARIRSEENYLRLLDKNFREASRVGRTLTDEEIESVEETSLDLINEILSTYLTRDIPLAEIEKQVFGRAGSGYRVGLVVKYYGILHSWPDLHNKSVAEAHSYIEEIIGTASYKRRQKGVTETDNIIPSNFHETINEKEIQTIPLEKLVQQLKKIQEKGTVRKTTQEGRIGQDYLRKVLLKIYSECCALCETRELTQLCTSHIVKWSSNEEIRLEPQNAILLCRLHDGLFEHGLIGFSNDLQLIISERLNLNDNPPLANALKGMSFRIPSQFPPSPDYIAQHRDYMKLKGLVNHEV